MFVSYSATLLKKMSLSAFCCGFSGVNPFCSILVFEKIKTGLVKLQLKRIRLQLCIWHSTMIINKDVTTEEFLYPSSHSHSLGNLDIHVVLGSQALTWVTVQVGRSEHIF